MGIQEAMSEFLRELFIAIFIGEWEECTWITYIQEAILEFLRELFIAILIGGWEVHLNNIQ